MLRKGKVFVIMLNINLLDRYKDIFGSYLLYLINVNDILVDGNKLLC